MAEENDIRLERDLLQIQRERLAALDAEAKALELNNKFNIHAKEILQKNLDLEQQSLEIVRMEFGALKDAQTAMANGATLEEINLKLKRKGLEYSEEALKTAEKQMRTKGLSVKLTQKSNAATALLLKRTVGVSDA